VNKSAKVVLEPISKLLGDLIGDRAYDSDPLDEELRKDGSNCGEPSLPRVAAAHPSLL
jgi:hypothetical protein